ncbi:MAG: T9SS type A sorting domain-containing protein [Flavobacteriales bacterium]|nr:T9SS type A sorting domain-containing protein [Flavobacteriales bacterium]
MRSSLLVCLGTFLSLTATADGSGHFTENKGQWPAQVHFRALFGQHAVFVERDAWTVVARASNAVGHHHIGSGPSAKASQAHHAYRVRFVEANGSRPQGGSAIPGVESFLLGRDPAQWGSHARRYAEIASEELYPGIDLRLRADGSFKYELWVEAGASPDLITLAYEGQDGLQLEGGGLLVHTSVGTMIEAAPVAFQVHFGTRRIVACDYVLDGDRLRYSFPEGYDRTLPLVIDPSLVFSTYSGSTSDNFAFGATYDATGHLYACGTAFGLGYPTTLGAYQTTWAGGDGQGSIGGTDIVLTKFALDGTSLLWSTFLGGTGDECPLAAAVNAADELFLLAVTGSPDHPTTPGAYDQAFHGGPAYTPSGTGVNFPNGHDLVIARLSADGGSLIAGTYLGGTGGEGCSTTAPLTHNYGDNFRGGLVLSANGDPIAVTSTSSTDLPTPNAPQPVNAGGQDGYVFRMNAQLSALPWATYLGGSGDDAAYTVRTNSLGEIIVTGGTTSSDLTMNGTPFHGTFDGVCDGYVARYSATGDQLLSSTYLGTAAYDQGFFIDIDAQDAIVVLGQSEGGYPMSPGLYGSPNSANFVQKLSADLSTGIWSTLIGNGSGTTDICPIAFGVDGTGRILLCGFGDNIMGGGGTTSGLPVTTNALQPTTDGNDLYIAVFEPGMSALHYATFLGGALSYEHADGGSSAFDDNGNLYLSLCAGCGMNSDLPTTPGAWSTTNNAPNCNAASVKLTTDGTTGIVAAGVNTRPFVWPTLADAVISVNGCDAPPCDLTVTDATGRVVWRSVLRTSPAEIPVDQLSPGVYHARMGEDAQTKSARFIVR